MLTFCHRGARNSLRLSPNSAYVKGDSQNPQLIHAGNDAAILINFIPYISDDSNSTVKHIYEGKLTLWNDEAAKQAKKHDPNATVNH